LRNASARPRSARIGGAESICCNAGGRIVRLAERDESHAELTRDDELSFHLLGRSDADRAHRAAAPSEIRQRVQRGPGAAAIIDERPKCSRAHVL
jgi:hypothetical protein